LGHVAIAGLKIDFTQQTISLLQLRIELQRLFEAVFGLRVIIRRMPSYGRVKIVGSYVRLQFDGLLLGRG
jgi:hypothetical protein